MELEGLRVCGLPGKMYLYIRDVPILPVSMFVGEGVDEYLHHMAEAAMAVATTPRRRRVAGAATVAAAPSVGRSGDMCAQMFAYLIC